MARIITETIEQLSGTPISETRIILRPTAINMRDELQNTIVRRIEDNNSRLPSTPMLESIPVIDRDTIIEINNSTSSERRIEFMRDLINHENIRDNSYFLLANSTNQVRTYLHDLLIRSSNYTNISEIDLYRVGNIFLYSIINIDIDTEDLLISDIIQHLRENMIIYNTEQILQFLEHNIPLYDEYLEGLGLYTERQMNERTEEFYREVDNRIIQNRRRVLYAGAGLLGSIILSSLGLPPIGGLAIRSLTNELSNTSHTNDNIIRLRDIFDASLKKILELIQR